MAGIKIKDLLLGEMKRSGLSARGLAVRMGLPPQSINNWIDSNTHPSAKSLVSIAAYFKVRPGDLIDNPGEPAARECGQPISSSARRCPGCGKYQWTGMRIVFALFILFMAYGMIRGCAGI